MKHIKLLGLLATAAALSFTVTSCSNGDAGGDVEFPPPGEEAPIPEDIKGVTIYIYELPSLIQGAGTATLRLYFGETRVSTEERTTGILFPYSVSGPSTSGSTYTYTPLSKTTATITIPGLTRPTVFDEAENKYKSVAPFPATITLKYNEAAGTYSVLLNDLEYTNVSYSR